MDFAVSSLFEGKDDRPPKIIKEKQRHYLERAAQIASKSTMTHKHGAVLVKDGVIVCEGVNHYFSQMCHQYSVHAEVDALKKAKKKFKQFTSDMEMYVVRIGPEAFDYCLKYSKPCENCQKAIEKSGLKKVYYSTNVEWENAVHNMLVEKLNSSDSSSSNSSNSSHSSHSSNATF